MKANTYPIFEADQILTSGHLNDLVVYLEEQERLTRNKLIGIGIVCGLELSYERSGSRKEIKIAKGCGITSEGYLVTLDETICTHIREEQYVDPVNYPDLLGMELTELLTQEEASLEEAEDVSPISTISENSLQEKAVLLYLEKLDEDLKNCIPEDCNDKGKKRIFTLRKLLVNQADLRDLVARKKGYENPPSNLEELVHGAFYLPEVYLPRVSVPQASSILVSTLQGIYSSSINVSIPQLAEAISSSSSLLQPVLSDLQEKNLRQSGSVESTLKDLLDKTKGQQLVSLQYFYDFLQDLTDAYHEFREEAFELLSMCCPDEQLFGCHLMLGEVMPAEACTPSLFRHRFHPSPIHDHPSDLSEKVRCLYQRLILMLESFELPQTPANSVVVTPSKSSMFPLSQRAIPYYYKVNGSTKLYNHWDYDKKRQCRSSQNLGYHSGAYAEKSDRVAYLATTNPLRFNLAKADFFRIEGHIGKRYTDALDEIQQARNDNGLPFDVVALKLGTEPDEPVLDQTCFFQDLDSQFSSLRQEMLCFLTSETNYFANIDYQPQSRGRSAEDEEEGNGSGSGGTGFTAYEPMFNFTNYSKKSQPGYYYYGGSGSEATSKSSAAGSVLKTGYTGYAKSGTVGGAMKDYISGSSAIFDIQDILNNIIVTQPGLSGIDFGSILIRLQYPLQMIQLLEDAVDAIPDQLHELVFEDFKEVYDNLIDKAKDFKAKIEENLASEQFEAVGNEEDISDHLDRFIFDCNLSRFKALHDEYVKRVQEITRQSLLANYAQKHPGLEHMGGVPKGGTFVVVYYDQAFTPPPVVNRPGALSGREVFSSMGSSGIFNKYNAPPSNILTGSRSAYSGYSSVGSYGTGASAMGSTGIGSIANLINLEDLERPNLVLNITNKVVVADFALPYICCSDCPPVSYIFPSVEAQLSLPKKVFCKPDRDQESYPFSATPEGGEVKGPGVSKDENGSYIFTPSGEDVNPGMQSFTYEADGRKATLQVEVVLAPKADFQLSMENLGRGDNGVFLSIANESENADNFLWEVNGQSSTDKDLRSFFIPNPGDSLTVKLTATNKACFDTATHSLSIAAQPLLFDTDNGQRDFCANDRGSVGLITKPEGGEVISSSNNFKINKQGNKFSFVPSANLKGLHTLEYTDPDKRKAQLQILISEPNANFSLRPTDADGQQVEVLLIPVDRTADLYTWSDGNKELLKTATLASPGPKVVLDFRNASSTKTISLKVDKEKCSNSFSLTTDIKSLIDQLGNLGGGATGASISVGRGTNTLVFTSFGRGGSRLGVQMLQSLGVESVEARKLAGNLPLTVTGISKTNLERLEKQLANTDVKYSKK